MASPHKTDKNSASVFVRFSGFFLSFVCCSQHILLFIDVAIASMPLLFSMLCAVGLMGYLVVILYERNLNSFERFCSLTLQTFLIMRISKHILLA